MVYRATTIPATSRLFKDAADRHALPLALVLAVAEKESSFHPGAFNPEPAWRYFWDFAQCRPFRPVTKDELASEAPPADFSAPPGVPKDAEWWLQQCSLGALQVMGGVARELGFDGMWLTDLMADPDLGVKYGALYLRRCYRLHGPDLEPVAAAYNAGSPRRGPDGKWVNQAYVTAVCALHDKWAAQLKGDS